VFTLLFLSALFLFLFSYGQWFQNYREYSLVELPAVLSLAFIFDDLSQDFLILQDMSEITFSRAGENVSVLFSGGFNSSKNYSSSFSLYEQFIETNYSQSLQVPISLDFVNYGFAIPLYGVSTSSNASNFYIFTQNSSFLQQINITFLVSNGSAFTSSSTPSSSTGTVVHVQMLDSGGKQIYNNVSILSASSSNSPFRSTFVNGSVDVYFQMYSGRAGTLWFDFDHNISILSLELVYRDINRTVQVDFNVSTTLSSPVIEFSQTRALGVEG